ncbi:MAG: quinone-interacting membrane-bound oxidoreductase complex subunit QmoC [Acidobacteria bacterium]|nr:quinone-interacting membrane-bound oxidoreductase complex subunit QmoC [Acidobacteriota bacterium]
MTRHGRVVAEGSVKKLAPRLLMPVDVPTEYSGNVAQGSAPGVNKMASTSALISSPDFRQEVLRRGGETAARCYQCATCSAVCELAPAEAPFPRRQMLWTQWGLVDRLAADPSVWLCHQCNDCTTHCPRDARPGDILQVVRGLVVEGLAFPQALGRLVANARTTWPILFGVPLLFWIALLGAMGQLQSPADFHAYDQIVPHVVLYSVFFPLSGLVMLAAFVSGWRYWRMMGVAAPRAKSFLSGIWATGVDIATHKRFGKCGTARFRRLGHLLLFWGFVGAAVTSGLLIVAIYLQGYELPLPLLHPYKLLGNVSAVALVVGAGILVVVRITDRDRAGASNAFDSFFATVVGLVIATGILVELARVFNPEVPVAAVGLYVLHLGVVTTLFVTFPYSKFAHMLYRTLAMVHEQAAAPPSGG